MEGLLSKCSTASLENIIIGTGDIASVLHEVKPKGLTFLASGVSNSGVIPESEYERERRLIVSMEKENHVVYFSSLSILFSDSRYLRHKREMEHIVKNHFNRWTIVRIGNITWGKNPNTIINTFKRKISDGDPFPIKDEYRHLLNKDEFIYWMNLIEEDRCSFMSITGRFIKVEQIVEEIKRWKL